MGYFFFFNYIDRGKCLEPTCNRPCYVEGATTYDYCGQTHARRHMQSIAQLWAQPIVTTGHGSTSGTHPQISQSQSQPIHGLNLTQDLNYGELISVM